MRLAFAAPLLLDEVDSTNRYLADAAREGAPEGAVVVADHQVAGRGRLGRRWHAPPGSGILCSVCFRPVLPPERRHVLSWAVALSARAAVRRSTGVEADAKWPNDLESGGRKLAGVLAEVVGAPDGPGRLPGVRWPAVVVGIGLNVNWPPGFPPSGSEDPELRRIEAEGAALNRLAGREIDRLSLLRAFLEELRERCAGLAAPDESRRAGAIARLEQEYRTACVTLGRFVRVTSTTGEWEGRAIDVDDEGALLVEAGGTTVRVASGDVVRLR
jgi:BirA family biotin operon repressor/biotin-[acetyl-CoA-carboxylase] ligase